MYLLVNVKSNKPTVYLIILIALYILFSVTYHTYIYIYIPTVGCHAVSPAQV